MAPSGDFFEFEIDVEGITTVEELQNGQKPST